MDADGNCNCNSLPHPSPPRWAGRGNCELQLRREPQMNPSTGSGHGAVGRGWELQLPPHPPAGFPLHYRFHCTAAALLPSPTRRRRTATAGFPRHHRIHRAKGRRGLVPRKPLLFVGCCSLFPSPGSSETPGEGAAGRGRGEAAVAVRRSPPCTAGRGGAPTGAEG